MLGFYSRVVKMMFKDNKPNGPAVDYYKTKEKQSDGTYVNGKKHGKWLHYYKSQKIKLIEEYYKGKKHGHFISYSEKGIKIMEGDFKNDK